MRSAVRAHTGHIAKDAYGGGVPALASHLGERYGDAHHALGLLPGKGSSGRGAA
ncbi:hypothetical protein [Streptomyces sp. NPDC047718]|uniref:hypothetical protein n=1 Tax=Streptomyces sp. NPDC047718 TaxID=3155479 RepID=UPI0033E9A083